MPARRLLYCQWAVPSRPSEQILMHFYRGELTRSDTWRTRLDQTTNWALTTAAAVISFSFASPDSPHVIVIVGAFLVCTFLLLEARRYRYYDLWIRRVRLLEDGFVAPALRNEEADPDLLRELADVVTAPRLMISAWDAVGLRLRRTYAPILLVLLVAWVMKIVAHPRAARGFGDVLRHAHIGLVPGWAVLACGVAVTAFLIAVYVRSMMRPLPRGELETRRRPRRPIAAIFRRPARLRMANRQDAEHAKH